MLCLFIVLWSNVFWINCFISVWTGVLCPSHVWGLRSGCPLQPLFAQRPDKFVILHCTASLPLHYSSLRVSDLERFGEIPRLHSPCGEKKDLLHYQLFTGIYVCHNNTRSISKQEHAREARQRVSKVNNDWCHVFLTLGVKQYRSGSWRKMSIFVASLSLIRRLIKTCWSTIIFTKLSLERFWMGGRVS